MGQWFHKLGEIHRLLFRLVGEAVPMVKLGCSGQCFLQCKRIGTQLVKLNYCNSQHSPGVTTGSAALEMRDRLFHLANWSDL